MSHKRFCLVYEAYIGEQRSRLLCGISGVAWRWEDSEESGMMDWEWVNWHPPASRCA